MAQSKFAMRMLEKQGWKEGDGLGKNRDGISKPIKAFMKRDKAGVGQDLGADLTDHWWLRVFNDAAKSNTTKTIEVPEVKQNSLYAGFRKGSTLKQGKEEKDSDCSSEDEMEKSQDSSDIPTLDDIHKYCGGATGHRAATLGIKMTGKLKRAADHERLFNERVKDKMEASVNNDVESNNKDTTVTSVKRKKKDKEKVDNQTECVKSTSSDNCVTNVCEGGDLNNGDIVDCDNTEAEVVKRKKSKKLKRRKEEREELSAQYLEDTCSVKKRKKSKSKDKNFAHSICDENSESLSLDNNEKPKGKKKKKHKD